MLKITIIITGWLLFNLLSVNCRAQLLKDYSTACKSMKEDGHYLAETNYQSLEGEKFKVCTFKNNVDSDISYLGFWVKDNKCYMMKTISTCEKVKLLKNMFINQLGMTYNAQQEGYTCANQNGKFFMNTSSDKNSKCIFFIIAH
jgi:hypothetical protein